MMKPGCIIMIRRVNRNRWNGNMPLLRRQRSSKPPGPPRRLCRTIFWDSKGVIHIDYLPHGTTMNGKYYANLLKQVRQSIKEKRRGKSVVGLCFTRITRRFTPAELRWMLCVSVADELLPHPPYSPDLAPSDFHLFP